MLISVVEEELEKLNLTPDEFSELLIRLLDYGVINRDESQVEGLLYDRFLRCSQLLEDYLSVMKIKIQHDRKFCFIRVYPPSAVVPGLQSDENSSFNSASDSSQNTSYNLPYNNGFRTRPTQQDVAVILVLRVEYEKALREGQVDEKGCVMLSLEGLAIALKNLLKRSLPENQNERKTIFRHLRQLRLIKFNSETDLDSEDSWLSIQPAITSFVSTDVLENLYPQDTSPAFHGKGDIEVNENFQDKVGLKSSAVEESRDVL